MGLLASGNQEPPVSNMELLPVNDIDVPGLECAAEITGRPLLAITCADIGTDPEEADESLQRFFRLGESWGAIMLLDEADIYLEQRLKGVGDHEHNSLVSSKPSWFFELL
jgi:hypothetical protein